MQKMSFFTALLLIILGMTSCSSDMSEQELQEKDFAYLAINVDVQPQTRESLIEEFGKVEENIFKSLYFITFDASGNVLKVPGSERCHVAITSDVSSTPDAVKIAIQAKSLVVVANPGPALLAVINALDKGGSLADFNNSIQGITVEEITGDAVSRGFTMITQGTWPESDTSFPSLSILGKMIAITGTEADAKALAQMSANRVPVKLERLVSKLRVQEAATVAKPTGSSFTFLSWTIDALNTTYYPFARKTLGSNHTPGADGYTYNFYTQDPNYTDVSPYHSGLTYGTVKADASTGYSYEPRLPWNDYYGWKTLDTEAYVPENTMEAIAQRYGNATRLVIKATYYPAGFSGPGDWFQWAGVNYTFTTLQSAYGTTTDQALKDACDKFYRSVSGWYADTGTSGLSATDFAGLTQGELDRVSNGGQVAKDGVNAVVRWFQKGLNYYYYEIRHDNEADADMAFGKYGVVRNNRYHLTLESVSGSGTPWYPDLENPGPGDPDPKDPIDQEAGYLGITVGVGEWILWDTGFGI